MGLKFLLAACSILFVSLKRTINIPPTFVIFIGSVTNVLHLFAEKTKSCIGTLYYFYKNLNSLKFTIIHKNYSWLLEKKTPKHITESNTTQTKIMSWIFIWIQVFSNLEKSRKDLTHDFIRKTVEKPESF